MYEVNLFGDDMNRRVIWQYWETKGVKPLFVDTLHDIAKKNSGIEVVLVTPETIEDYIPNIPKEIFSIKEMAHKADMIRALLIYHHGGMWLDSDAIVLSDLNWMFDKLSEYEFLSFNNTGSFDDSPLNVRINCFVSRPKSKVMKSWVEAQHNKFPKIKYEWTEVGTGLLDPIVLKNRENTLLLPFDKVCPIKWDEVSKFSSKWQNSRKILEGSHIVMLSNKSLQERNPRLAQTPISELAEEETLIGDILKKSLDSQYVPLGYFDKVLKNISGIFS